ncbi:MAG: S-layer protein domain-containing protein [Methanosarcina sp.]
MKKVYLQIFTALLVLGLLYGTAGAVPVIISPNENSTVQGVVGETQTYNLQTNESTIIEWLVNGENAPASEITYNTGTNTSVFNYVVQSGSNEVQAVVQSTGESRTWIVTGTQNVPVITLSNPSSSSVNNNVGEARSFTATVNQPADMSWYLDGTFLYTNSSVTESMYSNSSAVAGTHTIRVEAQNGNGTAEPKSWTWTVGTTSIPVNTGPSETTIQLDQGRDQTFNVSSTNGQNIRVEWFVNDESERTDESTSSSYNFEGEETGQYTVEAVITDPNGIYGQLTKTWTVNVQSSSYTSGNRIWDASRNMSTEEYTWNAQSYSGFFYDLNTGVSSEEMTITDISRSIDAGNIEYVTRPTDTDFEYGDWGSYQVIGFMAEKYFAGYNDNSTVVDDTISPISDGILAKILVDTDEKTSANSGDSLALEEGYALNIMEVDVNGETVWVQLEKDGEVVDEAFISSGDDYVYEKTLGESEDVPVIIAHFGTVFAGTETSAVFIQGLFQISEDYIELQNGDTFGEMEVTSLSSSEIRMENEDNIGLDEGETIDLMGKVKLQVADDNVLRFAPVLDTSESGTYELRGTVYEEDDPLPIWSPLNFEGFYYNIDEGIGTEELRVEEFDGRDIPSGSLVYESTPQTVEFEHNDWDNFTVVGFMADKYFAGYPDGALDGQVDDVSLLSDNILTKVLTDTDDKESMSSGSALVLEEGYSLNVVEVDVNGETVWVQLEKDGEVVDEAFISSGDNYIYEADLGEAENIPLIIANFGTVFAGSETSAVFIEGLFQISDEYIEINNEDTFGEMEISSISESGITMKNEDDIGLGQDETVEVMGNVSFKTADDDTLRFYPFVEVESGGNATDQLKINVPEEIIVNEPFEIEITAADKSVEGASVTVNETEQGETDANGIIEYTAEELGPLKITAEKEDYSSANRNVEVIPQKEGMSLNITPETVYVGDTITIETLEKIGGNPIEDVNVSVDGQSLGKTGSDGKFTYTANETGTIEISAVKAGYANETANVRIRDFEAIFEVSNLVIDPLEVSAGDEAKITATVENKGNAAGNYTAELRVNESVVDTKSVPLEVGQNTTVSFEHVEEVPGTYNVQLGDEIGTYTVKEKSSMLLYVLGAIVLLIIGGIGYFFTKSGGDFSTLQEKVKELFNSVNPKK